LRSAGVPPAVVERLARRHVPDTFDRVQLEHVIQIARKTRSLSDAGRMLFNASRTQKTSANDADRLRKYLARFGLEWKSLRD